MRRSSGIPSHLTFLVLALLGLAINLLLLVRHFSDASAGIAGCGGGGCDELLGSRWSMILGLPVTGFGLLAYAGLLLSLAKHLRFVRLPLVGVVAGAAVWFIFLQAGVIGKFCPWCMTAHGVGLALLGVGLIQTRSSDGFSGSAKRVAGWAAVALVSIGMAQWFGPVPATHRIDDALATTGPPAGVSAAVPPASAVEPAVPPGRQVTFDGGRRFFDVSLLPRRGSLDAAQVMVEYFDYQCAACQTMAGFLEAFLSKHPSEVALLLLPVPLDGACNPHAATENQHAGSCEISRLALAVWRQDPEAFPAFHRMLMAEPSVSAARRLAAEIIPAGQLEAALADPWIDRLIRSNIADWKVFSATTEKLPKLLIRPKRILHGLPSGEADFIRVMEAELGLQ